MVILGSSELISSQNHEVFQNAFLPRSGKNRSKKKGSKRKKRFKKKVYCAQARISVRRPPRGANNNIEIKIGIIT